MAIDKIQSESINLADNFAFTGTVTGAGGANTPAFEAYLSANQTITNETDTKVQNNTEVYDTDNAYDNSTNFRFLPTVAGKYFVYGRTLADSAAGNCREVKAMIFKNGSVIARSVVNFHGNDGEGASPMVTAIVDMNGSSDYVELFGRHDTADGSNDTKFQGGSTERYTIFGAYKIIT